MDKCIYDDEERGLGGMYMKIQWTYSVYVQ
jgi:hypothetical protein